MTNASYPFICTICTITSIDLRCAQTLGFIHHIVLHLASYDAVTAYGYESNIPLWGNSNYLLRFFHVVLEGINHWNFIYYINSSCFVWWNSKRHSNTYILSSSITDINCPTDFIPITVSNLPPAFKIIFHKCFYYILCFEACSSTK